MKISQQKMIFPPITLTLESLDELALITAALGEFDADDYRLSVCYKKHTINPLRVSNKINDLYSQLLDAFSGLP